MVGRAHAGSAAQETEAPRPGMKNRPRINRQQGHRAAQQHGEQVERDRTENQFFMPDVVESREHSSQTDRLARARLLAGFYPDHRQGGGNRCKRGRGIHQLRAAKKCVQQSAEGWAENGGGLKNAGAPGHGIGKMNLRHKLRQQSARGWKIEGANRPEKNDHSINRVNGRYLSQREQEEQRRTQGKARVAKHDQPAAV